MLLTSAIICLASNVFFESRGEPIAGQIAVANVTMNRARHKGSKVCEVVLKPKQFSWTAQRVKWVSGKPSVAMGAMLWEPDAWARALAIAQLALWHALPHKAKGATYYHEAKSHPYWARHTSRVAQIGNHIFYR